MIRTSLFCRGGCTILGVVSKEDGVNNSSRVYACPVCFQHFFHSHDDDHGSKAVFGYGLDFRLVPRDCNRSSDVIACPECRFTALAEFFENAVSGAVREIVQADEYTEIFRTLPNEDEGAKRRIAHVRLLEAAGSNPRDLGIECLRGSWVARETCSMQTELELLERADAYLDDALRRGLTKGDPGMVIYLLGEVNRRRGEYFRAREMLTFLGNNPRYRYPALLLTVLVEEEDSTPYWSYHSPDQMEQHSPGFKGLFPPLRSIPPGKTDFYPDELSEQSEQPD